MNKPHSSIIGKFQLSPKALALLGALLCLVGAWKMAGALAAAAQPPRAASIPFVVPLRDINLKADNGSYSSAVSGGTLYFSTTSSNPAGNAFWKTDGTEAGTVIINALSHTQNYTAAQNGLYFTAFDPLANESILFYSDGTQAGTTELKRWAYGECSPYELVSAAGILFFKCQAATGMGQLWVSDGTAAGTVKIAAFQSLNEMIALGDRLYFAASQTSDQPQLWKSNGTHAGTVLVKDLNPGSSSDTVESLANIHGMLFFSASNGVDSSQLWKSDGTPHGTVKIKDFPIAVYGDTLSNLADVNGAAFFSINGSPYSLWKSDGSEAGTLKVKDFYSTDYIASFTNVNGVLFFTAIDDVNGEELWRSDGTEAGTLMVKDINPGSGSSFPGDLISLDGVLLFSASDGVTGIELWRSDGTADGTMLVKDFSPGSGSTNFDGEVIFNGRLMLFTATAAGLELWQSDGTQAGTTPVKLLTLTTQPSYPNGIYEFNGQAFFAADDGVHGFEVWKSDGTAAGTVLVSDIYSGFESSLMVPYPYDTEDFGNVQSVGDTLFFVASDGVHERALWKTDGTAGGTALVKQIYLSADCGINLWFTEFNGELFFSSTGSPGGLWKSDGTESGTVLVHQFPRNPKSLLPIGDTLFFISTTDDTSAELWKSDGTITGTQLVKGGFVYHTGPKCMITGLPDHLTDVGGTLFFAADDGVNGYELWKSDGTEAGTLMVKDIVPGNVDSDLDGFLNVNGVLFFNSGFQGNMSLWKSDGTEVGTVKIKDIATILDWPRLYQDKYYFTADDGLHDFQLWVSDGTQAGTFIFKEFPYTLGFFPAAGAELDGWLYFRASDGVHGMELWRTNGTPEATVLVADINPGSASSEPHYQKTIANLLLFSADNGVTGAELWALNSAAGLHPVYLPMVNR